MPRRIGAKRARAQPPGKPRMAKTEAANRTPTNKKGLVYQRIVLKLSGESLQGTQGYGIHAETVASIASEVKEVHDLGVEIAIMVGGGNIRVAPGSGRVGRVDFGAEECSDGLLLLAHSVDVDRICRCNA